MWAVTSQAATESNFSLGVAAGDVTTDAAVLWTRADEPGTIRLLVATSADLREPVITATAEALPEYDLTVKIDVGGLTPATDYFYRFERQDDPQVRSRVGRFRTAPPPDEPRPVRFAFSGDSNFARTPFVVLSAAARESLDLFIWYGDTIYADLPAGDLGVAATLDEYRAKYRQIRSDPHVQDLLARVAVWVGWDDHEVRNDYAGHDPDLSPAQREAAYRAFFEYMPIREQGVAEEPFRIYRSLRYGALAEFFFIDNRQYRDVSAAWACGDQLDPLGFVFGALTRNDDCAARLREPRTMLGAAQRNWLLTGLANSTARYKFVVGSVPFSFLGVLPYDRWDGYDAERRRLLEFIDARQIKNVVFLSTDIHASAYVPDAIRFFRRWRRDVNLPNAVRISEIIAGPIGMATFREEVVLGGARLLGLPPAVLNLLANFFEPVFRRRLRVVSGFEFLELDRFGYAVVEVTPERAAVTFRGLRPTDVPAAAASTQNPSGQVAVQTLHTADLDAPGLPVPCALPLLPAFLLAPLAHRCRESRWVAQAGAQRGARCG